MNLFKRIWLFFHLLGNYKTRFKLEADIDFLEKENSTVFEQSEDDLRQGRAELAERLAKLKTTSDEDKVKKVEDDIKEIDRILNRYNSIKLMHSNSVDELKLTNAFIKHIKKCLKF